MGKMGTYEDMARVYACGQCVNCQLNAKARRKKRPVVRKCVHYDAFVAARAFDYLEITSDCVLRMRKPDWDVTSKSVFFNQLRQMRLAMMEKRERAAFVIEEQKRLRKKYNRDLLRVQEALQRMEDAQKRSPGVASRRCSTEVTHVDSDVFDSLSKQLVPAATLLPDVTSRVAKANEIITTEERNLKIIEAFVRDKAVRKLQSSGQEYLRGKRWRSIWITFKEDAQFAAAVVIQSLVRMYRCKKRKRFLLELRDRESMMSAAERLRRFFRRLLLARQIQAKLQQEAALQKAAANKQLALNKLRVVVDRIACRLTLWRWKEIQRQATAHDQQKTLASVILIQRMCRGFRERISYRRIRYRRLLSTRVRGLFDRFITNGDLWSFLFEVDADYRRFEDDKKMEEQDASTFVSTLLRQKRAAEDQMMQEWFTASALESPIVKGAQTTKSTWSSTEKESFSTDDTLSHAILNSPMASDLSSLSPNSQDDVFPYNLPPMVVRYAMCEGFPLGEIVAVMRGMIAEGKNVNDTKSVVKILRKRAPLMRDSWKPERVFRKELRPEVSEAPVKLTNPTNSNPANSKATQPIKKRKRPLAARDATFVSGNLLESIPGGLNGSIDRLVLVASLKSFDPTAAGGDGAFVFPIEASADLWRCYLSMEPSLIKIRREQQALHASSPYLRLLKEKQCLTAIEVLNRVQGIEEMVVWGVPRPLVMAIYDVIEQIHRQSVNISDRSIKRQMRVSAQFEAFWKKRQHCVEVMQQFEEPQPETSNNDDIEQLQAALSEAIKRDVLNLPLHSIDMATEDVLFKAFFLVCHYSCDVESMAQHAANDLSRSYYDYFLREMVLSQRQGDVEQVEKLVRVRMETARTLAVTWSGDLVRNGIKRAHQLVNLTRAPNSELDAVLVDVLRDLLKALPEKEERGRLPPAINPSSRTQHQPAPVKLNRSRPLNATKTSQLSPLIQTAKPTIGTLDEHLRGIKLPF
ncbi:hypothetical protein Poli38472_006419 [Pythium oligandrum]|uniref:Uncharacterized protein n=1 Tax=Pythium oligandrum TaxID=41045 RepID=A0A8K1C4K7_PYTOL|nr:hypothetical protein Poli38472_006419 [Pythium oligandrum]|eukprot:TMW56409.1 hypothetical protein Poli38472_006419 [Pythium oligandrum]